jgi:hypothetical protein
MFLPDLVGVVWRRWYIVLAGMLLTIGLGLPAVHTPNRYTATEVLVLKPPVSSYAPNPVTGLNPSLAVTGAAVANRLSTPDAQTMFRSLGVTGTYSFDPRNTGTNQQPQYVISSIGITSTTGSEEGSLQSLQILADTFESDLRALQNRWNVAANLRITVAVLVPPTSTLVPHAPARSLIGAALLGMLVTGAVALWTDEAVRRRRARAPRVTPLPEWTTIS